MMYRFEDDIKPRVYKVLKCSPQRPPPFDQINKPTTSAVRVDFIFVYVILYLYLFPFSDVNHRIVQLF